MPRSFLRGTLALAAVLLLAGCPQTKAPPPSADETVYRRTGRVYAVLQQPVSNFGSARDSDMDLVKLPIKTVGDVAEHYAEFSRKEVRVARDLASHPLTFSADSQAARSFVPDLLRSILQAQQIEIVPLGRKVVAFRALDPSRVPKPAQPQPATPQELERARSAMTVAQFWKLIEIARALGHGCESFAEALTLSLKTRSTDELLGFQLRLNECLAASYRWDLWAVAYLVNGGASDDGFEYFRGWLISQGRVYFEAALQNPERAADRASTALFNNECEAILYPAIQLYEKRVGRPMPYLPVDRPAEPIGKRWKEEDLPQLYPTLARRMQASPRR